MTPLPNKESFISDGLTQLEQEVFDYLNDTPNAREQQCNECKGKGGFEQSGYLNGEFYMKDQRICNNCGGTGMIPGARIETLAARISHEMDVRYSEALVIVEKWRETTEMSTIKIK